MSEGTNISIKAQNKSAASSLMKKNVRKFLRNKLAVLGLLVVVVMVVACAAGAILQSRLCYSGSDQYERRPQQ